MHARVVRSAAVAVAVTATLSWAPAASAQPSRPAPSGSSAPAETAAPDAGSVEITTKDAAGDVVPSAVFLLLDSAGQETGRGKTDAQGKVTFPDLAPGVYRLKEVSGGSPLYSVVDDQDVIVTPGADTPLTITAPFTPAMLTLRARDSKSGKLLPGSTVTIGTGETTLLTLTTGSNGTASAKLPVNSRTGTSFWAKQTKAPAGHALDTSSKRFTAKPGDPVTVTVTNATKTSGTTPAPTLPAMPSDKPATSAPAQRGDGTDSSTGALSSSPPADAAASRSTPASVKGELAHTGADATPWLLGGTGTLLAAGGAAVFAARQRRTEDDSHSSQN
ncbi:collagen binding domain-containing protein [Streptomyces sp. GbtcB6]|uniref:MSCRAMM family protein n=1 Tax=Streptomyces sp. GbtcB6 TaxID=2824751 RepID=UPI001C3061CC|nr:SpaA isopeptide-forming pilin-related protein [Streptomyces sp. GbtcB6]